MKNTGNLIPERLSGVLCHHAQSSCASAAGAPAEEPFKLPPLAFAYDALEPYIDAQTVAIHHDKHHAAYVANLNKAITGFPGFCGKCPGEVLRDLNAIPAEIRTAVINHGGGVANHNFYWKILGPDNKGAKPKGELAKAIDKYFGSFDQFQDKLTKAATGHFGSGWGWLTLEKDGTLLIESTSNQDCPLSNGREPLLTIDVWEHAYYLKYQNRRPEHTTAIWNLFNWDFVSNRYAQLIKDL
ncbi:MAG: superoxide dismutase [Limisphaerales bacterium]|jgi:Fe-Mn family superoxide dismutase|nr:superoxide dismutase [Verrucomicrobiota bacterium]